jgi:hypothetical protein
MAIIFKEFHVSTGVGNLALDITPLHSVKPNQVSNKTAQNKKKDKNLLKISNSL